MSGHAENSPSSAGAWSICADYINANRGLPDDESEAAREGTIAHEISDMCLTLGLDAYDFVGMKTLYGDWSFEWTDEDADLLQPGIEFCRSVPGTFYSEQRVDLTDWVGLDSQGRRQGGTLDRGFVYQDDDGQWWVRIADLKWGRGVAVSPVNSKQLQLYALGFYHHIARHAIPAGVVPRISIIIDQPRNSAGGGEWITTLNELLAFGDWIKERAEATRAPNPPRTASDEGCLWCRRRKAPGGCATFDAFNLDILGLDFDDLDDPDEYPDLDAELTPERRWFVLQHRQMIQKWLDGLHADAIEDGKNGRPLGGAKVVLGRRSPKKWRNKDAAEAALVPLFGDASFTRRLITPTAACKQGFSDVSLIEEGEQKLTLVPEADERPAIEVADDYEDLPTP